jgi:hypothetical protein
MSRNHEPNERTSVSLWPLQNDCAGTSRYGTILERSGAQACPEVRDSISRRSAQRVSLSAMRTGLRLLVLIVILFGLAYACLIGALKLWNRQDGQ